MARKKSRRNSKLPGPKAKALIRRDNQYVSPSYTRSYPAVIESGSGAVVIDVDGNGYLDFAAGIAVCNTGHCHPLVVKAIQEQAGKLIHMSGTDFYYEAQIDLAQRLDGLVQKYLAFEPLNPYKSFFGNSGAEAVEAAFKLARYKSGRPIAISFEGAFHGRTMGALSLTASKAIQKHKFYPLVPQVFHFPYAYCYRCAYNLTYPDCGIYCVERIKEALAKYIPYDQLAAIFVEPIQGEGGYVVPPKEFHQKLKALCMGSGAFYVVDEVQSGMGRTGKMFAIEHFEVTPDILCLAKGIASGMPLGVMMADKSTMNWKPGYHASTFGGNPISCRAALTTIGLLEGGLVENAEFMGRLLKEGLYYLQSKFECIGDVRGEGLMLAIELVKDRETKKRDGELRDKIVEEAFQRHLLLLGCGANSIRFSPPLVINEQAVDQCLSTLEDILNEIK